MHKFTEKFNRTLKNKFNYLRFSSINISVKEKTAEFNFVCPENLHQQTMLCFDEILAALNRIYETSLKISLKIKKSHFDDYFFTLDVIKFFDSFASLKGCVTKRNFVFKQEDGKHIVKIILKQSEFLSALGIAKSLNEYVYRNYCEDIDVSLVQSDEKEDFTTEDADEYAYDNPLGRVVDVIINAPLVGYTIYDKPVYIADACKPVDKVVLSGKILDLKEFERSIPKNASAKAKKPQKEKKIDKNKQNTDENKGEDKDGNGKEDGDGFVLCNYYKFMLDDTTGKIPCVYFANEKTQEAIRQLRVDSEIVASGKLEDNIFNGVKTLTFYIKKITLCEFPKDFKINRLKRCVPSSYKFVKPEPYIEFKQQSLFGKEKPVAPFLLGKEFCVFDIETTGLSLISDRIIELGAVKIKNGVITETFSTLVDPECPIGERIESLTGISDNDVKNARLIGEILPDFLKFSDGTILLGHNSESFDYPILSRQGAEHKIYFDNQRLDTLVLAKKYLKLNTYRLGDIARHYGIENENAHRAVHDALTTAKIFMFLAEYIDNENEETA